MLPRTSAVLSCDGKKKPTQLHKKRQGKTIMNNKERWGTGENCCTSVEAEADDWPIKQHRLLNLSQINITTMSGIQYE